MERQHFKRAHMMMAAIRAIIASNVSQLTQQAQIAALGPYKSRGKGRGTPPRNFHGGRNIYDDPTLRTQTREKARRLRQIERGPK